MLQRVIAMLMVTLLVGQTNLSRARGQGNRSFKQPAYFAEGTIAAWKKAGAKVGWSGMSEKHKMEFADKPEDLKAAVPAFKFTGNFKDVIQKLPAPKGPFGLILNNTQVTNEG